MATAQHGKGGAHILIKMTLKCIILHWLSLGATPMHHLVPWQVTWQVRLLCRSHDRSHDRSDYYVGHMTGRVAM